MRLEICDRCGDPIPEIPHYSIVLAKQSVDPNLYNGQMLPRGDIREQSRLCGECFGKVRKMLGRNGAGLHLFKVKTGLSVEEK